VAVARGAGAQLRAQRVLGLPFMQLLYAALVFAFCYHLVAGIRHLVWDTGRCMERAQSQRSARLVVIVSVLLTLLVGYAFRYGQHAP
jgi:succinate dehydrogenase / fumarate reductase, cytochrome b subunit